MTRPAFTPFASWHAILHNASCHAILREDGPFLNPPLPRLLYRT